MFILELLRTGVVRNTSSTNSYNQIKSLKRIQIKIFLKQSALCLYINDSRTYFADFNIKQKNNL